LVVCFRWIGGGGGGGGDAHRKGRLRKVIDRCVVHARLLREILKCCSLT
jgi:hypothetical protein